MAKITTLPGPGYRPRARIALLAALVVTSLAAWAPEAGATIRFEHHTDPAGDPTVFTYQLLFADGRVSDTTQLSGDGDYTSFGGQPGTYIMQASPPAGWRVADIQCVDDQNTPNVFQIDVPNGRVILDHSRGEAHQVCAFTNARVTPGGGGNPGSTTGVAPTPVAVGRARNQRPRRTAVSRVVGGRRKATATVRLARRSVVRATLFNGRRKLVTRRIVRSAGEHALVMNVPRREVRRLRARGRTRATLRLRVVLAERGGATRVFSIRVRVRL
jgi:hypothetical protein